MLARVTNRGPTFAVNITRSQLQIVLEKLEQHDGADLINEGQVTTLSGKQAQFQTVDTSALSSSALRATLDLNLVPTVSDDGSTIQIDLVPTVTEFLGTNQPGVFVPAAPTATGGLPIMGPLPLPHSRVRQITFSSSVKDGQTLVLVDFPGKPGTLMTKNLLIFVTPTLVDPFGHRIHSGDYYDFPVVQ
jgi:hypothetical protein